jgi:pyridoxal/pyridoxine/pyridoxamine kinase
MQASCATVVLRCSGFDVDTCQTVRLSRFLHKIEVRKHDMCILMTFSFIERRSAKQPSAEMQCTDDDGLLALSVI